MYRIKSNSQHPSSRNQGWSGKKVKSKTCHIPTIFDLGKGGAGGLNFLSILSKMVYTKSLLGFWVSLFELMTIVHLQDSFFSVYGIYNWYAAHQDDLIPVAGQGHWNDPDMVSGVSLQRILPLWPRVGKRRVSSPKPSLPLSTRTRWQPFPVEAQRNSSLWKRETGIRKLWLFEDGNGAHTYLAPFFLLLEIRCTFDKSSWQMFDAPSTRIRIFLKTEIFS